MLAGSGAARHYGYSSARVKSMESQILDRKLMHDIINAKDVSTILTMLFQTEFKKDIEDFGGMEIKHELIDFALSRNLARNVSKLVQVSPTTERKLIRSIVGKWDLYNAKTILEAKARGIGYDAVAGTLIDYGVYNSSVAKEIMREESIENIFGKLMLNSPYRDILSEGLEVYKKDKNLLHAIGEIDKAYYKSLGGVITGLRVIQNEAARIIKMEIDMKNIMLLIRGKIPGAKFQDIGSGLIAGGNVPLPELEQLYNGARDIDAMVQQVKVYDLKDAMSVYKSTGQLLAFEISMKNQIFTSSVRLLNHSILSFGAILAYAYMKEIEIYTLRIAINSRIYGLSREETERLIIWKAE